MSSVSKIIIHNKEDERPINSEHPGIQFHKHLTRWWEREGELHPHWCIAYISNKIFMNTWAYTPTTDTAHWYDDSSSFATWIDDLERNPVFYSLCHSTAELKLASWEDFHGNQRTKTRWARHINKTDDITRWKDKHFFSKGYQHTKTHYLQHI